MIDYGAGVADNILYLFSPCYLRFASTTVGDANATNKSVQKYGFKQ